MGKWKGILLLAMLVSCFSCKQTTTGPTTDLFDFPLSVGSIWTYATYDSLSFLRDTVEVRIVGTTSFSNEKPATLWRYKYTNRVDTLLVTRSADTLTFNSNTDSPMFLIPLKIGSTWGRQYVDTFSVTSQVQISLPSPLGAVISYPAFVVEQQSLLPNDYSHFEYWIVPNIGIARILEQKFVTVQPTRTNTTWTLLSYSIAQ